MTSADVLMNLASLIVGAGLGVAGALLINEQARYRAVMDDTCHAAMSLLSLSHNATDLLDLRFAVMEVFKSSSLRLTLLEQGHARKRIAEIIEEYNRALVQEHERLQRMDDADPQVTRFPGGRWHLLQVNMGFYSHRRHEDWIVSLRDLPPDWHGLSVCALRNAGLLPRAAKPNQVV